MNESEYKKLLKLCNTFGIKIYRIQWLNACWEALNAICENSSTSTLLSQELHGLPNVANFLLSKLHKMAATQGFDFDEIINDPKYKSILLLSGVGLVNDFSESECI